MAAASLLAILSVAVAQAAPAPAPPPVDCRDAAHRAFDFWAGAWNVTDTASGAVIARSRIDSVAGGCALRESYDQDVGPGNRPIDYHGTGYSALNTIDGTWRQFYVDTSGAAISYTGGIENGAMVLKAETAGISNRMTLRRQTDGSVRQSGEVSRDGGATWTTGYDFTYRPR